MSSPKIGKISEGLVSFVFALLVFVSLVAIFTHWAQLGPSADSPSQPPGPEWFSVQRMEFKKWPWLTQLHLVSAFVFIVISPFQFSESFRRRRLKWHRILGRVFLISTLPMVVTGLVLGIVIPFGGLPETLYSVAVFLLVLLAAYKGLRYALLRQIRKHQAWMVRLFAWATSIATMRIILGAFYGVQPWSDRDWFWITLHLGLIVNFIFAEIWIRKKFKVEDLA